MLFAALSYQKLTSIDYSAIILNQVRFLLIAQLITGMFDAPIFTPWLLLINLRNCLHVGFLDDIFNVQRYWKLRKYLQANQWLEIWLKRELQALIQVPDLVYYIAFILLWDSASFGPFFVLENV